MAAMHRHQQEVLFCHSNCTIHNNPFIFFTIKPLKLEFEMVRILHQITNIFEPWMNERLETLAGVYAAAVKVYLNDIVHALTMSIIRRLQAKIVNSLHHNVVDVGYVDLLQPGAVRLHYSMSPQAAF